MVKAILFDMSGVVFGGGLKPAVSKYAQEFGISEEESDQIWHNHPGWTDFTLGNISEEEYFKVCQGHSNGLPFEPERFKALIKEFMPPNQELIEYIRTELADKYTIGIISNLSPQWYERLVGDAGIKDLIKLNIVSGYIHIRKPDVRVFQAALDQAGLKGEEVIYVDDRADRVQGAEEVGMKVIIFDNVNNFKTNVSREV